MTRAPKSQGGVILIEALIGILIFSIGILALIGMQAAAMKNSTDAKYRSEAAFLANQIIGQMWADRVNLQLYNDKGAYHPRLQWDSDVAALLPGTDLPGNSPSITVEEPGATNQVTVLIKWRQPNEKTDRTVQMTNWINFNN